MPIISRSKKHVTLGLAGVFLSRVQDPGFAFRVIFLCVREFPSCVHPWTSVLSPRRKAAVAMATPRVKRKRPPVNSPGEEHIICPICLDPIIDATEDNEGQEAIFCESRCDAWLQR